MTCHLIYRLDPAYGSGLNTYTDDELDEMFGRQGAEALRTGHVVKRSGASWVDAAHAARRYIKQQPGPDGWLQDAIAAADSPAMDVKQPHGRDVVSAWSQGRIRNNTHAAGVIVWLLGKLEGK